MVTFVVGVAVGFLAFPAALYLLLSLEDAMNQRWVQAYLAREAAKALRS
jgi:hypothetical protein